MRLRTRKFIGAIALLALVAVWSLGAVIVAERGVGLGNPVGEFLYYLIAGLGWTLPAGAVIWWAARPDRNAGADG